MNRVLGSCSAFAVLALHAAAAEAGEVIGGVYAHGLGPPYREEGTADVLAGYRTDRVGGALRYLGSPHVHAMASINTQYDTDFFSAGFDWRLPIASSSIYVRPGLGLAGTTGKVGLPASNAPGLSPAEYQRRFKLYRERIDFGSEVLFEPELSLGWQISHKLSAELSYIHYSNGQIFHTGKNQGVNDLGLRLSYRLGAR